MDNKKQNIFIYTNTIIGISCNLLLLYLVITDKAKNNFGYKRMLMIITCYNIYYASLHPILEMSFLMDEYGFVMFSRRFADYGYTISYLAIFVYMCAFNMSLTLLAIHCLYRYVKVSGRWQFMFQKKRWICLLIAFNFAFGPLWCLISHLTYHPTVERTSLSRQEAWNRYNVHLDKIGYIGPVLKLPDLVTGQMKIRWFNVLGSFGCTSILLILYTAICSGCLKLYLFIKKSLTSQRAKKINMQLFRLLVIQAIAPLLFDYSACIIPIWGGFFGFRFPDFGLYVTVLTSGYSIADSLMVIIGFKVYRQRVFGALTTRCGTRISSQDSYTLPKESTDCQKMKLPSFIHMK